jgi:regulator of protease activity HflC (stomatin/prohibitin superfamily)
MRARADKDFLIKISRGIVCVGVGERPVIFRFGTFKWLLILDGNMSVHVPNIMKNAESLASLE